MRNTLSPAFTSSKMKLMFILVAKCAEQMGEYLEKLCADEKDGVLPLEMKDFFTKYTNDVIATAAFGIHCDSLKDPDNEFYRMGKEATNFDGVRLLKFVGFLLSPKLMQLMRITFVSNHVYKFFLSLVTGTMTLREREHIVRPDMIHLLMEARKGTLKAEADADDDVKQETDYKKIELTDGDITAQVFLFFLAGFDSVATLICFVTHLLAVHPDVQRRVQLEVDGILKEDGGEVTYEGVQRMKYIDMVISETLRLWPPAVATDRVCVKPYTIAATDTSPSVQIKKGQGLNIPIYAIHRDPEFYPDPERFDPERFSDENKHSIKPFTYLPFGVGPRNCIGMRFALIEAKLALACLLKRFDLEVTSKTQIPLSLSKKTLSVKVDGGFWIGIRPREK